MNDLIQTLPYYQEDNKIIKINDTIPCEIREITIGGNTKFKATDGTYSDVWKEGSLLSSVGSNNKITLVTQNDNFFCNPSIKSLNASTGQEVASDIYFTSDFQESVFDGYYKILLDNEYVLTNVFYYDESKNFLSQENILDKNTFIPNQKALYMRFVGRRSDRSNNINLNNIKIMVSFENYTQYFKQNKTQFTIDNTGELRGFKNNQDIITIKDGVMTKTQKIGIRAYQSGDENNINVMTDKKNTIYVLFDPVVTTINLEIEGLKLFNGNTILFCSSIVKPTLSPKIPYLKSKHSLLNMYYDNKGFMEEFGGFILEGTEFPIVEEIVEDIEVEGNPMGTLTQKTGGYKDLIFNPTIRIIGSDWRNKTRQIANWLQGGKGKIFFSNDVTKSAIVKRVSFSSPTFQANSYTEIELTIVCEPFYYNTEQEEIIWNNGETKYIDTDIPCTPVIESSTAGAKTNIIFNEVHFSVLNASEDFIVDCAKQIIQEKISKKFLAYEGDFPVINNGNNKMGAGVNSIKVIVNERYRG